MPAKKQASPEDAPERRPARTNGLYLKTAFSAVTAVCAAIKKRYMTHSDFLRTSKKEPPQGLPCTAARHSTPLLIAVAAGAVLAFASVADVDGLQLAVAAVHIELAFRDPARNAAVDLIVVHRYLLYEGNMRKSRKIIQNPVDKAPILWYNISKGELP